MPLQDGFNLIGWTGAPTDPATIAAAVGPSLRALFAWDADRQQFRSYRADAPVPAPSGDAFPLVVQTLQRGWNLVGWSGATTGADAFDFVTGPFRVGFTYDAVTQQFQNFSSEGPNFLNTLQTVDFGDGVWILAD